MEEGGVGQSVAPGAEEKERKRKKESEQEGDGRIGRIENRRAIRETQQKDSITSHKESKPSGEINKRSPLLAIKAQRRKREKTGTKKGTNNSKRTRRRRKRKKTSSAMTCVIEIPSVRSILSSTLTNIFGFFLS